MALRKIILTHNSKLSNFDKMLKEVFPSSIPSQYCDKLIITDERGNEETTKVEIYLNLAKVEAMVNAGTEELFKNANLK